MVFGAVGNAHTLNVSAHALQALFLLRRRLLPVHGLLRKSRSPGLPLLLLPFPSGGQVKRGESWGAPGVVSRETSSPPTRPRSSERVEVSLVARLLRTSVPLSLQRSCRGGGCSVAADAPCLRRFLGCFYPLIAARSGTR